MAKAAGLQVKFAKADLGFVHPNTVKLVLEDDQGTVRTVVGSSVGGGNIVVSQINDFAVEFTGEFLLFVFCIRPDRWWPECPPFSRRASEYRPHESIQESPGAKALMVVETDNTVPPEVLALIRKMKYIDKVIAIDPID